MYIYPMVRFCTNNIITVEHLRIGPQGCALAEPSGPWRLTFALGRLENLTFFIQIICWAPWISQFQSSGLPSIFLRAQPWAPLGREESGYCGEVALMGRWGCNMTHVFWDGDFLSHACIRQIKITKISYYYTLSRNKWAK